MGRMAFITFIKSAKSPLLMWYLTPRLLNVPSVLVEPVEGFSPRYGQEGQFGQGIEEEITQSGALEVCLT